MWVFRIAALCCLVSFGLTEEPVESASASDNEVAASVQDEKFLRNFVSLHNATDLQALASDEHQQQQEVRGDVPEAADPVSRSDTGPRVFRGTHTDLEAAAGHDHPLFSPFKHNKIDTADFSDCALQGEWKPIGAPAGHYAHHEDHQKEHFHAHIEGHDGFSSSSIAVPNTHSPLDAEGVSFWNQLISSAQGQGNHQRPPQHPQHHHYPKKHQKFHHRPPPPPKYKPSHPVNPPHIHHAPPPPPPTLPHPVHDLDIFEHLRNPNGDSNIFTVQEKPGYVENAPLPLPQNLLQNQPNLNDIEFALLQATNEGDAHTQPTNVENHPQQNDDFLSPPPMPQQHKPPPPPPPRIQTRPKYVPRRPPQYRYQVPPNMRPPPPAGGDHHHQSHGAHGAGHHEHHEHQASHGAGHHEHQSPHGAHGGAGHHEHHAHHEQTPAESSTFTCGHNHEQGTNYHTASYQVEGEADPSLLDDVVAHGNHLTPPIIVGQPTFDHGDSLLNHRFQQEEEQNPFDLAEEGTETGGSDEEVSEEVKKPFGKRKKYYKKVESTTAVSSLETRAPQTFHNEDKQENGSKQRPTKLFYPEKQKHSSRPSSFEHNGHAEVKSENVGSGERIERLNIQVGPGPEYSSQEDNQQKDSHRQEVVHSSQPNEFFSSSFGSAFQDFNFDQPPKSNNLKRGPPPPSFQSPATSFQDFSFPAFNPPGNYKGNVAVFDHSPHNGTRTHVQPKKKRPHKTYEVMENSGERIPLSALFPPRKMPKQFDMRMPNLAVPKSKLPKPPPPPPAPKYQSSLHFDGSNMGIYQSHPRNKVTKIRLKSKRNRGYTEPDFRRSLTISSRIK